MLKKFGSSILRSENCTKNYGANKKWWGENIGRVEMDSPIRQWLREKVRKYLEKIVTRSFVIFNRRPWSEVSSPVGIRVAGVGEKVVGLRRPGNSFVVYGFQITGWCGVEHVHGTPVSFIRVSDDCRFQLEIRNKIHAIQTYSVAIRSQTRQTGKQKTPIYSYKWKLHWHSYIFSGHYLISLSKFRYHNSALW